MTMMKQTLLFFFAATSILLISSCGGSPESKLIGTWKVSDVQTDFREAEVTPETYAQVVEIQKQTHFRILNDSTMVIISNNNTHEAKWFLDETENEITYFFSGMESTQNKLGKFKNSQIISESETPLGTIMIYYDKE